MSSEVEPTRMSPRWACSRKPYHGSKVMVTVLDRTDDQTETAVDSVS